MSNIPRTLRRRWLVPEVVQTSAMDCGPAALAALLTGCGVHVSYGRLREACQTDVDGTSIDTIEEVAGLLGLHAEQIMVPLDHLLLEQAHATPAIVVVSLPNGQTHFTVAWHTYAGLVQCMDPAQGRRWLSRRQFLDEVYIHSMPVAAAGWRDWAGSSEFLDPLRQRLAQLGLRAAMRARLIDGALAQEAWLPLAALDAATRMTTALVRSGGLRRGPEATRALVAVCDPASVSMDDATIPAHFWSVRPAPPDEDGDEQVLLRGAVLVRVTGMQSADALSEAAPLSRELLAARQEPPLRAGRELLRLLRTDGVLTPLLLLGAALVASAGVVVEGLLFRGLLDLSSGLARAEQRGAAMIALIIFATILLLFEFPIATSTLRFGRKVEIGLRLAFLRKIPLLSDRYFQSRPVSDMAERSHSVQRLRLLMDMGRQITLSAFELVLTALALAWLYPAGAPIMLGAALLVLGIPLLAQPVLWERDLRVRTHLGALGRFYLDALLGLVAIRTHHAERAVRREHEALTTEWARAGFERRRATVAVEGLLAYVGYGAAAWLLFSYLVSVRDIGVALLLTYWAIKLPLLGERIAQLSLQYPTLRTTLLRLLEPLGAPEQHNTPLETHGTHAATRDAAAPLATRIDMQQVHVQAAGHPILHDLDLAIAPGSHVAIIGPSGAGKSSLVGLLLGWHRPASGCLLVDGQPLDEAQLEQLRSTTAWVDPAVQLWNRALLDNLHYGTPEGAAELTGSILEQADLYDVLQRLPHGLQTRLGEGGGLVSGGEGQRVRFGRALLRPDAGLVILDEPFRGLDRAQRRGLLERARQLWPDATLLCITHDVRETLTFERVLVVEAGQIVEDGLPAELAARPDSRYQAMLDAEQAVHDEFWSSDVWRRLRIENGQLTESAQPDQQASADRLLQSEASHEQL